MRRFALCMSLLTTALAGCQSPGANSVPAVDPFAMYGHTRISPPGTGSYGVAKRDPYYSSAKQAGEETGELVASAESGIAPAVNLVDATKQPAHQASTAGFDAVAAAGEPVKLASNETPVRIIERVGAAANARTDLQGMTVTDATDNASSRLASSASAVNHSAASDSSGFRPVEGAATIRVLPSSDGDDRPLPVRGMTPARPSNPQTVPQPAPDATLPPATIQAGRFVPLDIATRRTGTPVERTIAANGN